MVCTVCWDLSVPIHKSLYGIFLFRWMGTLSWEANIKFSFLPPFSIGVSFKRTEFAPVWINSLIWEKTPFWKSYVVQISKQTIKQVISPYKIMDEFDSAPIHHNGAPQIVKISCCKNFLVDSILFIQGHLSGPLRYMGVFSGEATNQLPFLSPF